MKHFFRLCLSSKSLIWIGCHGIKPWNTFLAVFFLSFYFFFQKIKICAAGSEHHMKPFLNYPLWRKSGKISPNADTFSEVKVIKFFCKHQIFKKKRFKIWSAGSEHRVAPILNHPLWRKSGKISPNADTFSNGVVASTLSEPNKTEDETLLKFDSQSE